MASDVDGLGQTPAADAILHPPHCPVGGLALSWLLRQPIITAWDDGGHSSAFMTFIAIASNMSFLGLGAAFWGIVLGSFAHLVLRSRNG